MRVQIFTTIPVLDSCITHYYYYLQLKVLFESCNHKINIGAAYEVLGPEKSNSLLRFHVFIGCEQTSKFNGKSKATCWKTFLDASEDVWAAFANLGVRGDLADTTLTSLEKYVVPLFCESGNLNSLTDARWSMYTRQQDCYNLPPTKATLKFNV